MQKTKRTKHKKYPVTREDFKFFCTECQCCMGLLGLHRAPVTFAHEVPPDAEDNLGGSITYEDSQKILIYLAKEWPREVTRRKLKYLAVHEAIEILFTDKFLEFTEDCVREERVDYDKWQTIVHNTLHRVMMLYDERLMMDIAEEPVFEEFEE
jgi:hypothetical protein